MTDGPVRVMPRSPLVAEPDGIGLKPQRWWLESPGKPGDLIGSYTDAEFAAHFIPADAYERLIAAVGAWNEARTRGRMADLEVAEDVLLDAYRAYVEGES